MFKNIALLTIAASSLTFSGEACETLYSNPSAQEYLEEIPGLGLILDSVDFEGIRLSDLRIEKASGEEDYHTEKYAVVSPRSSIKFSLHYELDSEVIKNLDLHHFVYGLYPEGPTECLLHSLGLVDRSGDLDFEIEAPEASGVYQLRFCHQKGWSLCSQATEQSEFNDAASSKTIMAVILVK